LRTQLETEGGRGDREEVQEDGYITDLITDEAVRFIQREREETFFLYVPYTSPHTPYQGPQADHRVPKNDDTWNEGNREDYKAMVERLDEGVGRILNELQRQNLDDNTVFIFTSDNGGTKNANNGPFAKGKGTLFEGGIRVPCIVRWPGVVNEDSVTDQVALTMDVTASLLRIAGARPPQKALDGMDVLRGVADGVKSQPRTVFWRKRRGTADWRAVRDGDMKYVSLQNGEVLTEYVFDLLADQSETKNLIRSRPDETARLKKLLHAWEEDVKPYR